jgi:AraC-like DNA-binding protein
MPEKPENFAVSPRLMVHAEYGRYDALSDTLQTIRLHGGEVSRTSSDDSTLRHRYAGGMRMLHMIESGVVHLSLSSDEPTRDHEHDHAREHDRDHARKHEHIELFGGDMVVLARGDEHTIGTAPAPVPTSATWLTGEFTVEPLIADPLLKVLAPAIVIRSTDEGTRWLPFSLDLILEEVTMPGPGSRVMVARLIELLFIRALRAWAASGDRAEPGWLTAAMDPVLGPVLTAIHRSPERDWSVEELAKLAAVSRSAFAARFTALIGQPPGAYVLSQRLEHAAHLLRSTTEPVGRIAALVGYESEAAFSRAFARAHGQSPRAWRTTALSQ